MEKKETVAVLLAAYNGEKWIDEQIQSILGQRGIKVSIYISLDLSSDRSLEICKKYAETYENIFLLPYGDRFGGAAPNFYRLIKDVDFSPYDFISFADQDDIWLEDKLSRAARALNAGNFEFYSSNVTAFYEDGRECLIDKAQRQTEYDFLFESAGPGCTFVLKKAAALKLQKFIVENFNEINEICLHDWLIYSYARTFKYEWYIDPVPSMRYRQHANNQVGANNNLFSAIKRVKLVNSSWYRNEIIKIAKALGNHNLTFFKRCFSNGYLGCLYLSINSYRARRRLRDKWALFVLSLLKII